ncbi:hypothetical protein [Aquitalea pelogenes]|uniref:hypothetical protein n=1 Tax=Aquitalea pelogenes TaxID=1293573 RepID=UPI0035AF110B
MKRLVIVGLVVACLSGCDDSRHIEVRKEWPAPASAPVTDSSTPAVDASAPEADGSPVLTGRDAAIALSDYINRLNLALRTNFVMQKVYLAKVKQAYQFRDLDKLTEAAEAMKESAQKAQGEVYQITSDANLSDDDAEFFNSITEAVQDVMAVRVELAVDVAAQAHTGMEMLNSGELQHLIKETKDADAKLKAAAKKAYSHFGTKPADVDWNSLTLKASK